MSVAELLVPTAPPIREDLGGILRIGNTRVLMDSLVWAYNEGLSAEQIVCEFDTLTLELVHAAISFYLANREAVDAYIRENADRGDRTKLVMQKRFPVAEIRERILARRAKRLADHAG